VHGVSLEGQEVTFDPASPGTPTPVILAPDQEVSPFIPSAVSCASVASCTAVGVYSNTSENFYGGAAVTFDPASPGSSAVAKVSDGENLEEFYKQLITIACPTETLCAAINEEGNVYVGRSAGPPENTSPPTISGTAEEGQTLTEEHGSWTNEPSSFSYQWEDCNGSGGECEPIEGATSQTYLLAPQDVGHTIRMQETASNEAGSGGPATSEATAVVQPTSSEGGPLPDEQGAAPNESELSTTCSCGAPVNTATGAFWHIFTDAQIPGLGIPLDFTRTYSSADATLSGPLGYGWTDSYEMRLTFDGTGNASIAQEDGAVASFLLKAGSYQAAPGVLATLVKNGDGTYTFKRNSTNEQFVFNGSGKLVSEIDRHGYETRLAYNGAGELTKVTDQAGRTLTLAYAGGHLASITDPLGRTTTFEYDPAGDLVETTDPLGRSWRFSYDAQHLLLTMTDPNGGVTTNTYDGSGRVTKQVDPAGRILTFSYSGDNETAAGGTTTVTDPRGLQAQYRYKSEELTSVTAAAGTAETATTSYQYDPATFGQSTITDADGKTTTNTYDSRGDLLSTTDPLGNATKYTYDGEGDRLTATDALGITTTYTYDPDGDLLSSSTPLSGGGASEWSYTYGSAAQAGDMLSSTNPDGKTTTYTYDAAGDQTSITDPLANKTTMTDDADGRLLTRTTPDGGTTTNTYDADGELAKMTDPLGHSTTYTYDANGNTTSTTDANGHTTTDQYDADNELTQTTQPDGSTTKTSYDGDGNIISQTDGNDHTTSYSFNALNQTASTTDPDGRITKYTYDGVGNLITSVNASGQTTTYSYDADRRTTAITYSDGTTPAVYESYDADGRRVSLTDGTGPSTFVYDNLGRLISQTNGAGATSSYTYDPAGNVTRITYPNGKTVDRTYDADNRLTGITDWLGDTTTFAYDGDGNLTAEHLPGSVTSQSAHNAADQLTGITDSNADGNLATFTYARDPVGQVTSSATTGAVTSTDNYSYDSQNRLVADNAAGYGYDAGNNPTSFNGQPQRFDAADQLIATGSPTAPGGGEPGGDKPSGGTPSGGGSPTTTPPVEHGGVAAFRASSPPPVTIAATAKTHSTIKRGKLSAGPLTTSSANELLLAFVSAQGPAHGQRVGGITGGGLHWSRVTEASSPQGISSIWQARAPSPLGHADTFTASLTKTGYSGLLDVLALAPGTTVGPVAKRSGAHSPPSLTLNASAAAMILAVAHDSGPAHARKALGSNHITDQALGGKHGGTSWALSAPGGTGVIGLGGPKSPSWSLAAVAVLPGATTARVARADGTSQTARSSPSNAAPGGSTAPLSVSPSLTGETTYTYNPEGDRTAIITPAGTTTLSYDQADRLTAVGEGIHYSYNGDGLRMSKTAAGETTAFAWDESHELPLLLQGGTTSYIYGLSGQPTEQITGTSATYLLGDQQGSTRLLTNSAGAIVGTYSYDAWGNVTSHTGETATNLQYDGQYTDAETGYQYLRARFYDPSTGQFLTPDPLVAQTRSVYVFASDDPVNASDPTGQCWAWARDLWNQYAADAVQAWQDYGAPADEALQRYYALKSGDLVGYVEAGLSWWQTAGVEAADYLYAIRANINIDLQNAVAGSAALNFQNNTLGTYASAKAQLDAVYSH
jgi:RHS repeat-associated protein